MDRYVVSYKGLFLNYPIEVNFFISIQGYKYKVDYTLLLPSFLYRLSFQCGEYKTFSVSFSQQVFHLFFASYIPSALYQVVGIKVTYEYNFFFSLLNSRFNLKLYLNLRAVFAQVIDINNYYLQPLQVYLKGCGKRAILSVLLIRRINIPSNYKADLYYREGVIYKYKYPRVVYSFSVLIIYRLLDYKDLVVYRRNTIKERAIRPLIYISAVILNNCAPIYLGQVQIYLYLYPIPILPYFYQRLLLLY